MKYHLINDSVKSKLERLTFLPFEKRGIEVYVQREDLIHPEISGNKWRKLKYNLKDAIAQNKSILTFGGAYSNHIAATAAAGRECGVKTIGIIRGDELNKDSNATLKLAQKNGMDLVFVDRSTYRMKDDEDYLKSLSDDYPNAIIVPEGGSNSHGVKGCEEILNESFDLCFVAAGTGSTSAGIINSQKAKEVKVVSALKGDFLKNEIAKWTDFKNWELLSDYHFGGYAKYPEELKAFQESFEKEHGLLLDPVYTAKLFYGMIDYLSKSNHNNCKVVVVHTGGLQGRLFNR